MYVKWTMAMIISRQLAFKQNFHEWYFEQPKVLARRMNATQIAPAVHPPLHSRPTIRSQPKRKRLRIPRLHKYRPGSRKLTHQPFASMYIRQDAARRHALKDVFAVPSNQVAVVDDVFLVFL